MERVNDYFSTVEAKLKLLVEVHQKIKIERDQLNNQAVIYQKTTEEQKKEIEHLKSRIREMEIAGVVESTDETVGVKEKIQDLVREIDRCIELLNK
ncbi:MAG: hypothetical protein K0B08_03750 [Bacteroidales bacterium]|nr:hypothetical protein [Bacteroidales bacterium]